MRFSAEDSAGSTTASTVTALVAMEDVLARELRAVVSAEIMRSRTPSESSDDGVLLVLSVAACACSSDRSGASRGKSLKQNVPWSSQWGERRGIPSSDSREGSCPSVIESVRLSEGKAIWCHLPFGERQPLASVRGQHR